MNYLTRYYFRLNQFLKFINQKLEKLKKNFLSFLLTLFLGFFLGNLFGTLVESIRKLNIADSILIFIIILLNETVNFIVYQPKNRKTYSIPKIRLYDFLNIFKIGVLLGFFIDSFKVGS